MQVTGSSVATYQKYSGKNENEETKAKDLLIQKQQEDLKQANTNKYAVVDDFITKTVDIDGDGNVDLSHGDYIAALMKAENPNIQIDKYDVSNDTTDAKKISAYDQIAINNYAGINMSLSKPYNAEEFSQSGIQGVTQSNFGNKKEEIYNTYKNDNPQYNKLFSSMEKVIANGTPIFVAAGNEGSDIYNLLTTVPGVTSVGDSIAPDDKVKLQTPNYNIGAKGLTNEGNQILSYSAMNSGISIYGQGVSKSEAVEDANGKVLGYDINGDGKVDISNDQVSSRGTSKPINNYIWGTSFASPTTMLKETNSAGKTLQGPVVYKSDKQLQEENGVDQHGQPIGQKVDYKKHPNDIYDQIDIDDDIDDDL